MTMDIAQILDIMKKMRHASGITANEKTLAEYHAIVKCLAARARSLGPLTPESLIAMASKTKSPATWRRRRAALRAAVMQGMEALGSAIASGQFGNDHPAIPRLPFCDPIVGTSTVRATSAFWLGVFQTLPEGCPIPPDERSRRHSKRKDLTGLPKDWREHLVGRLPNYRLATLVAAVTGCRPAELKTGVRLRKCGGVLEVLIVGAKVTKHSGQEWRLLTWSLTHPARLVNLLAAEIDEGKPWSIASINSPSNFSTAVREAAKRVWPDRETTVTPYCFRHAAAADMKKSKMSSDDISGALGHAVDATKGYYGIAGQGRSAGGVAPTKVTTARKIKHTARPPQRLRQPKRKQSPHFRVQGPT